MNTMHSRMNTQIQMKSMVYGSSSRVGYVVSGCMRTCGGGGMNVQNGSALRLRRALSREYSSSSLSMRNVRMYAEEEGKATEEPMALAADEIENPESEASQKKAEAERLRAAEKFMVVGTGEAECTSCRYTYTPSKGDPEYPIAPGVMFQDLPGDWVCPVCGADKKLFELKQKEVAGFAENQGYGLGTNSMTGEQKSLLIFGSLAAIFFLFLLGYTMN